MDEDNECGRWWVYLVSCADGTLYTGMTTDVERRLRQHNAGKGARYTRAHGPVSLLVARRCSDRVAAMKLELKVKQLPQARKLAYLQALDDADARPDVAAAAATEVDVSEDNAG